MWTSPRQRLLAAAADLRSLSLRRSWRRLRGWVSLRLCLGELSRVGAAASEAAALHAATDNWAALTARGALHTSRQSQADASWHLARLRRALGVWAGALRGCRRSSTGLIAASAHMCAGIATCGAIQARTGHPKKPSCPHALLIRRAPSSHSPPLGAPRPFPIFSYTSPPLAVPLPMQPPPGKRTSRQHGERRERAAPHSTLFDLIVYWRARCSACAACMHCLAPSALSPAGALGRAPVAYWHERLSGCAACARCQALIALSTIGAHGRPRAAPQLD